MMLRSAGNVIYGEVFSKAPDLASGIAGDAVSFSPNILSSSRIQSHILSVMQLLSAIVDNLHRQDALPQHLQALVNFFQIWNYRPVQVDIFLKAVFDIFPPFLPVVHRKGLAYRFFQTWRKFLSLLGKWYKSLTAEEMPLLEDKPEEGAQADILKDDYDVAKIDPILASDFSQDEAKVLFSSWKLLEGITQDGIKYKLGPGAAGGSHKVLGSVVFMYMFRSNEELRYELLPNLNHLTDIQLLRNGEVQSYSLRVID